MANIFTSQEDTCPKCGERKWDEKGSVFIVGYDEKPREYFVIECGNCCTKWLSGFRTIALNQIT